MFSSRKFSYFICLYLYFAYTDCQLFTDITNKVFGDNSFGFIAAYADFDSDKKTDIFVIKQDSKSVDVYMAQDEGPFKPRPAIDELPGDDVSITSVIPGDFDGDSQTDLIITTQRVNQSIEMELYWGDGANMTLTSGHLLYVRLRDQPLILDFNGDLIPDIFGETDSRGRFFWWFGPNRSLLTTQLFNGTSDGELPPLHIPQSSAFADWDGNLTPDLLIVSVTDEYDIQIEIWVSKDGEFRWNETIAGPPGVKSDQVGVMSVTDIDESRLLDLIFPVCLNADCSQSCIYVYNHTQWIKLPIDFNINSKTWGFVPVTVGHSPLKLPVMLRVGDINLDGYPDYLVVLRPKCDAQSCDQKQQTFVLVNQECKQEECGTFSRTLSLLDHAPISPQSTTDLIPAFFDTSENGKLDVFMTTNINNKSTLRAYKYNTDSGSYFLKIMVVSGKCRQPCIYGDRSLGVNLPGPTTYYETVKSDGKPQVGIATQLSQSAYLSLQLPYIIYGLGLAPNAVDKLMVGVMHNNSSSVDLNRTWTYVVPNTQMIIIPAPQNTPSSWKTRLFMTPSQLVLLTAAALSGTFGFIIIIVAAFHWREYIVDKREKLQESQKFHFDAM